jgi:hypothetical protein
MMARGLAIADFSHVEKNILLKTSPLSPKASGI